MTKRWIRASVVTLTLLVSPAFLQGQESDAVTVTGGEDSRVQPIAFPHTIHAGQDQIDCQYCHFSAERSVDAGIPPGATGWGCHQLILGTDERQQAEIRNVRGYWERQEPIPWIPAHPSPDPPHFPNKRHLQADVACQTCHGPVETMDQVTRIATMRMPWCVDCHTIKEVENGRDCWTCHK